ncbi:MAG: hypothetical protein N4A71_07980 [Carboxylicivirga sp.]|jgi:hypothetical protein|nr:hypothetical protein [Carboxylicivirga sp.]
MNYSSAKCYRVNKHGLIEEFNHWDIIPFGNKEIEVIDFRKRTLIDMSMTLLNSKRHRIYNKHLRYKKGHILGGTPRGIPLYQNRTKQSIYNKRIKLLGEYEIRKGLLKNDVNEKIKTKKGFNEIFNLKKQLKPFHFYNYIHDNYNFLGNLKDKLSADSSDVHLYNDQYYIKATYDVIYPYHGRGFRNRGQKTNKKANVYNLNGELINTFNVDNYRGDYIKRNSKNSVILSRYFKLKKIKEKISA